MSLKLALTKLICIIRYEKWYKALLMAIWGKKPPKGLVWHTDRDSQYASHSHLKIIQQHGITQSMSRKGNCWDNAVAESFFHTIKNELIYQCKFKTS
jgi:transposase InsO family protein